MPKDSIKDHLTVGASSFEKVIFSPSLQISISNQLGLFLF